MDFLYQTTPSETTSQTLSSASYLTPGDSSVNSSPENQCGESQDGRHKKRGRKGHTKSRTGCFNCKRARIKCKENRPSCDYCAHRELICEWPDIQITQVGAMIRNPSPAASIFLTLRPNEPVFTSQDFRLFNHFIQNAYPHQPIGNDSVWCHEIPCIASDFDYLLHAMLALSASDLAADSHNQQLTVAAMDHRVKSIESLNKAVASGIKTQEQGNAMLAACYSLLFQATLIDDGLTEFMSFLRGIVAVAMQMGMEGMKFMFQKMMGDEQLELIEPELQKAPLIDAAASSAACRSLEKLTPLCQAEFHACILGYLLNMARTLITSSRDAFVELRKFYAYFMMMPYDNFKEYCNPKNEVSHLLQAHFVALQLIMTPISKSEWAGRRNATTQGRSAKITDGKTGKWLENIHKSIPLHMLEYYEWTLWVEEQVYRKGYLSSCNY